MATSSLARSPSHQSSGMIVPCQSWSDSSNSMNLTVRLLKFNELFSFHEEPPSSCCQAVLCDRGKGTRGKHEQNIMILCKYPFTFRPRGPGSPTRAGSCEFLNFATKTASRLTTPNSSSCTSVLTPSFSLYQFVVSSLRGQVIFALSSFARAVRRRFAAAALLQVPRLFGKNPKWSVLSFWIL